MATLKTKAIEMIRRLPAKASLEDIQYQLYVMQKIERGMQQVREGKVISHEEMKRRVGQWFEK